MIRLRIIDQRGQLILGIISLFSIPVLFLYGFLFGLLILGGWQLLSAGLNTATFIRCAHKKQIVTYWKWSAIVLSIIFFTSVISFWGNGDDLQLVGLLLSPGSTAIAIYYIKIYNDLIVHLKLRKELSGLLKS